MSIGGGNIEVPKDFEPLHHVQRAYKNSECRVPTILVLSDGDPFPSLCKLAKEVQSAVWTIDISIPSNEINALDYFDVGTSNGDWVYLTGCEHASLNILRKLANRLVALQPKPKQFPRREFFRLFFAIDREETIESRTNPFPRLLLNYAIMARGVPQASSKWSKKMPEEPSLWVFENKKRSDRREIGRDSDSESDTEGPLDNKLTGVWFHRAVEFAENADASPLVNARDELFDAIEKDEPEKVKILVTSVEDLDLNKIKRDGMTPLQYACSREKAAAAIALLKYGDVDPNLPREADGCPPILMAIESEELFRALIEKGINIRQRFEKCTVEQHRDTAPHILRIIKRMRANNEL